MPRVGLQLYTIRDECDRDLEHAIARVGELGYAGVELHSLYDRPADELRRLLDGAGLEPVAMHAGLPALETELPRLVDEAGALGIERLVLAWIEPDGRLEVGALIETRALPDSISLNMRYRVVEAEPERRLLLASTGRGFAAETLYLIYPLAAGSRVRVEAGFEPDTLGGRLIMWLNRKPATAQLSRAIAWRTSALLTLAEELAAA